MVKTMRKVKALDLRCQAFNQHLECCFAQATKICTDDQGLQWYACDAPRHDTKEGSHNVDVERLAEP
jgi:hypothetical protein